MALSGMRGLSVFISDVRNCQNKEQERVRVDKELGNVRSRLKSEKEQGDSDDTSGWSKEELGHVVASRWTGEHKKTKEDEVLHDTTSDVDDDDNGYNSETEDDRHEYGDAFGDEADEEDAAEAEWSYITDVDDKQDSSVMNYFYKRITPIRGNSLKDAASLAYDKVFAPHHGRAIRKAVGAGLYALPIKAQLLKKLNEDGKLSKRVLGSASIQEEDSLNT